MEIRPANSSDIIFLCDLLDSLFEQEVEFKPSRSAQIAGLKKIIDNKDIGDILLLEENGNIVGMVNLLFTVSTALGGQVAIMEDMVIASSHRSKGFGSALLRSAVLHAKQQGCKRITLLTDKTNSQAQKFYMRHGFAFSEMIPMRMKIE